MNFTIFGDRVIIKVLQADEEIGGILVPANLPRQYFKAQVIAVGDGKMRGTDLPPRKIEVQVGDTVFVQVNPMMAANNLQKINGESFLSLNCNDIIAKVDGSVLSLKLEHFNPVGRWVLLRSVVPTMAGVIYLPDASGDRAIGNPGEIKWYMAKMGALAAAEFPAEFTPEKRVLLEHTRANILKIDDVKYAYIDAASVAGFADESS